MNTSRYHSFLKIAVVVLTLVLLFDGGFVYPVTKQLSDNTLIYLGAVGSSVTASVSPNGINTLTAQLTEKEQALNAREAQLQEREIAARNFNTSESPDYSIYILSIVLFILTTLIVVNYVLDWVRIKNIRYEAKAV